MISESDASGARLHSFLVLMENVHNTYMGIPVEEMTEERWAEHIRMLILALTDEAHEFLRCLDWKPWKTQQGRPWARTGAAVGLEAEAKEELIDVFFFMLHLFNAMGMTSADISRVFAEKYVEVMRRKTDEASTAEKINSVVEKLYLIK